jgi:serine/threonine-protein kinase RsbW
MGTPVLELRIPSVLGFEKVAMDFAASVARIMKCPDDRVEDLRTAVAEACINAIEHGNSGDEDARVTIRLIANESTIRVEVEDQGEGMIQPPTPDIEEKISGSERTRGWGVFLMEKLMDGVEYTVNPEGGNVVRMKVCLSKPGEDPSSRQVQ